MKFEKKLLAAAVVSALSVNASAVIDLNSSTAAPTTYAEEQNTSSSQVYHVDSAKVLSGRPLNSGIYAVLFLLEGGGAQFTGTVPVLNATCSDTAGTNCTAIGQTYTLNGNLVSADTTNANNNLTNANQGVVFPISVSSTDGITATDTFTLSNSDIKLDSTASVNLTYRLYDDVSSAELFANDNQLGSTQSGALLKFAPVLKDGQPTAPTSVDINVGEESKKLEDSTGANVANAPLCSFDLQFDTAPLYNNTSSSATNVATSAAGPAAMLTTNTDGSKIVVSGDFSAAKDTSGNKDLTRVFMSDGTNCTGTTTAANAIADDFQSATFFFGPSAPNSGNVATLCYKPDGTTPIVEMKQGALTAQYQPAQATGFTVSNVNLSCGKLEKGGSTEDVVMVLNPASAYLQLMRITNPSATAGKVSITAINDKGVAGPNTMEFELPAGNSTGMINTQSIIDATGVVVGSGVNDNVNPVTGGNANKLRLIVNAEFGKSGTSTGVKVRTYAVSSDFTTFSQFD